WRHESRRPPAGSPRGLRLLAALQSLGWIWKLRRTRGFHPDSPADPADRDRRVASYRAAGGRLRPRAALGGTRGEARRNGFHLCRARAAHVRRGIQPVWLSDARLVGRGHPLLGAFLRRCDAARPRGRRTLRSTRVLDGRARRDGGPGSLHVGHELPRRGPGRLGPGAGRRAAQHLRYSGLLAAGRDGRSPRSDAACVGGALDPGGRLLDSRVVGPAVQTTEWGQTERLGRVSSHLGMVRHRSEVVEYRIEHHADTLGDLVAHYLGLTPSLALRRETLQRV